MQCGGPRGPHMHVFTRLVSVKQVLLRGQDLTVLLVLLRRLEALRVQQTLDAQLPARLTRGLQGAAGAHLGPGGGQKKHCSQHTSLCTPVNVEFNTTRSCTSLLCCPDSLQSWG